MWRPSQCMGPCTASMHLVNVWVASDMLNGTQNTGFYHRRQTWCSVCVPIEFWKYASLSRSAWRARGTSGPSTAHWLRLALPHQLASKQTLRSPEATKADGMVQPVGQETKSLANCLSTSSSKSGSSSTEKEHDWPVSSSLKWEAFQPCSAGISIFLGLAK